MNSQGVHHRAYVVFIVGLFSARLVASSSAPLWKDVRFFRGRHFNLSPQQQPRNGISSAYRIHKKSPSVQYMSSTIVPNVKNNANEVKIIASDNNIVVQNNKNNNVVAQLAKHIWTNVIVQFKQDVVQLYCNYQTCNDIKRQQRQYANQYTLEQRKIRKRYNGTTLSLSPLSSSPASSNDYYVQTGLSYSQHGFLRQGQQDFIKIIRFALFLNAKILPFALTLYPDSVIPSPFVHSNSGVQSETEKWSYAVQSRIHACLSTLCNVEQEITAPESASNTNVLSLFIGGKKNNKQQEQLHFLKTITTNLETQYLKNTQWNREPRNAEDVPLHEDRYQEPPREDFLWDLASIACKPIIQQVPFTKAEKSLCDVPPSIVRGLSQMIFTCSPTSTTTGTSVIGKQLGSILPLFIVRNRLTAHLDKIRQDDEFLMYEQKQQQSPLKFQDLREACHARCIGTSHDSFSSLSKKLSNWLALEEKMMQQNSATSCYYNANVARAYMMCINALQSTAEDYSFGKIPRLLYSIQSNNVNSNRYHHME